jgi:hypothetical protein
MQVSEEEDHHLNDQALVPRFDTMPPWDANAYFFTPTRQIFNGLLTNQQVALPIQTASLLFFQSMVVEFAKYSFSQGMQPVLP